MAKVTFPFRVKSGGEFFNAGEVVDVNNLDEAIKAGAMVTDKSAVADITEQPEEENPRRGRPRKEDQNEE